MTDQEEIEAFEASMLKILKAFGLDPIDIGAEDLYSLMVEFAIFCKAVATVVE
jgi:hypothetical protein